jgi:hypothetical protein
LEEHVPYFFRVEEKAKQETSMRKAARRALFAADDISTAI